MTEATADTSATGTGTTDTNTTDTAPTTDAKPEPKPTETVEFWKGKAREQEKRAKDNADAAKRLAEIEEANKTETQKAADRVAKAEAEVSTIPAQVSDALRTHLVALHQIPQDDADLFLTANDPELLLRQVDRLIAREAAGKDNKQKQGNHVPREGITTPPAPDDARATVRGLFGGG